MIVTYFAQADRQQALLAALLPQVAHTVVVDNTPAVAAHGPRVEGPGLTRVANGSNRGLAAAQNQGVDLLAASGVDDLLFIDDDSLPAPDMVARLQLAAAKRRAEGQRVGAVGPRWVDRHTGQAVPFVRLGWGRMHAIECRGPSVECDTLVSSGCLIALDTWRAVGPLRADLFIDQVDVEWCLRAQRLGFRLYGACEAQLMHGIGERVVRPWFARRKTIPVHSPVRDYYLVRNTLAVFFRAPAPWRWRLLSAIRLAGLTVVMLTQMPPRRVRARMLWRALRDAAAGRLGPLPDATDTH